MTRVFTISLTASYQKLTTLLGAVTGAIPTDGVLPNLVQELQIVPAVANSTTAILLSDSNNANVTGAEILTPTPFVMLAPNNSICTDDIYLKGNTLACTVIVHII